MGKDKTAIVIETNKKKTIYIAKTLVVHRDKTKCPKEIRIHSWKLFHFTCFSCQWHSDTFYCKSLTYDSHILKKGKIKKQSRKEKKCKTENESKEKWKWRKIGKITIFCSWIEWIAIMWLYLHVSSMYACLSVCVCVGVCV